VSADHTAKGDAVTTASEDLGQQIADAMATVYDAIWDLGDLLQVPDDEKPGLSMYALKNLRERFIDRICGLTWVIDVTLHFLPEPTVERRHVHRAGYNDRPQDDVPF